MIGPGCGSGVEALVVADAALNVSDAPIIVSHFQILVLAVAPQALSKPLLLYP